MCSRSFVHHRHSTMREESGDNEGSGGRGGGERGEAGGGGGGGPNGKITHPKGGQG